MIVLDGQIPPQFTKDIITRRDLVCILLCIQKAEGFTICADIVCFICSWESQQSGRAQLQHVFCSPATAHVSVSQGLGGKGAAFGELELYVVMLHWLMA